MSKSTARARANMNALGDVPAQLAALDNMTVSQLAAKHYELLGESTRSRNRRGLQKRLAFHIQASAHGGLTAEAQAKICTLGSELPQRWQRRLAQQHAARRPQILPLPPTRDPRLPPPGTLLRRIFRGKTYAVTVEVEGFSYQSRSFRTLSAVARQITGSAWNGFEFFGLTAGGAP
ncbi:MAG: DUF2924 domain-containing protein [Myxococcales bacterium]|nr:DUF2924 domain-containing protein [Myxococcales bacterium]